MLALIGKNSVTLRRGFTGENDSSDRPTSAKCPIVFLPLSHRCRKFNKKNAKANFMQNNIEKNANEHGCENSLILSVSLLDSSVAVNANKKIRSINK